MKRIEKLAREYSDDEDQQIGFEAGFRKAREMAAELCDNPPMEYRDKYEEELEPSFTALQSAIEELGEEEVGG